MPHIRYVCTPTETVYIDHKFNLTTLPSTGLDNLPPQLRGCTDHKVQFLLRQVLGAGHNGSTRPVARGRPDPNLLATRRDLL